MATSSLALIILALLSPVLVESQNEYDYFYYNVVDNQPWQLVWFFFFQQRNFQSWDWDVYGGESVCPIESDPNRCIMYNQNNIRQDQNYLQLNAVHRDKHITTANMCTKEFFSYGRWDVRAAFPVGQHLRFQIYTANKFSKYWHQSGQVNIVETIENQEIVRGVYWANSSGLYTPMNWPVPEGQDVHKFHLYSFEWSPTRLRYGFDDHFSQWYHYDEVHNETLGPVHQLCIKIDVDIPLVEEGVSDEEFVNFNWTCPTAVINYIRFFTPFHGKREDALFPFAPINDPPNQKKIDSETAKLRTWCYTSLARSFQQRSYNVTEGGSIELPPPVTATSTLTWVLVIISAVLFLILVVSSFLFIRVLKSKRKPVEPNPLELQPDIDADIYAIVDYGYHYEEGKDPYLDIVPNETALYDDDRYLHLPPATRAIEDEDLDGYLPARPIPTVRVEHHLDAEDDRYSKLVNHEHPV